MIKPSFFKLLAVIVYDSLLLAAVLVVATFLALPLNHGEAFSKTQIVYPLYLLAVCFFFYGWFWTHGGQTLGSKTWKLRLVSNIDHKTISWKQAFVRFLAAIVSWLCFGLGFIWILVDSKRRSWHDIISKTTHYAENS